MIFWIASYPKSGNTWLRALISTYYFSKDGIFDEELLKKIDQFPTKKYFLDFEYNQKIIGDTCQYWIKAQEKINKEKKIIDGNRELIKIYTQKIQDKIKEVWDM